MTQSIQEQTKIIFQEMLSHPALFSHPAPKNIAVLGENNLNIVHEILKHSTVSEILYFTKDEKTLQNNPRVKYCDDENRLKEYNNYFDIFIVTTHTPADDHFVEYFQAMHDEGVLLQLSESPFYVNALKATQTHLLSAGFRDVQTLSFPQPHFPTGWRAALMAKKAGIFKKIREKDIFNKTFLTQYYNFDVHKASLAMPEFMRKELVV